MNGVSRVLVVGGGIGGLGAATGLALRGVETDLIEIKQDFSVRGVGLGQPANALRALRAIGVLDECLAAGFQFDKLRFCDKDGNLIVEHRYRLGDAEIPALNALPRVDLHHILVGAATRAGVNLRLGISYTDWVEHADGVDVTFSDGTVSRYDLVVAFDGNRSEVRRRLYGDRYEPVHTGISAWRVTVDRPADVTSMVFYQGLGSKTGVMPLTENSMYLFHIRPEPPNARYEPAEFLPLLKERTSDYGGPIGEVMDSLSADNEIVYSPLQPVTVGEPWYRGRIVIGGDAAHACPPHMTQGAGMALEDGLVLAECVTSEGTIEQQLRSFMTRRLERVSLVQRYAGKMLADEQAVRTAADFEAAADRMRTGLSDWLAAGDRVMNQEVLAPDWPRLAASLSGAR